VRLPRVLATLARHAARSTYDLPYTIGVRDSRVSIAPVVGVHPLFVRRFVSSVSVNATVGLTLAARR
jgi:hypothetical protein